MKRPSDFWPPADLVREYRRLVPAHTGGDSIAYRVECQLGRQIARSLGWGAWDLESRARLGAQWTAFVARYSHGAVSWEEAEQLGMSELLRRAHHLVYWIKLENKPPEKRK